MRTKRLSRVASYVRDMTTRDSARMKWCCRSPCLRSCHLSAHRCLFDPRAGGRLISLFSFSFLSFLQRKMVCKNWFEQRVGRLIAWKMTQPPPRVVIVECLAVQACYLASACGAGHAGGEGFARYRFSTDSAPSFMRPPASISFFPRRAADAAPAGTPAPPPHPRPHPRPI